MKGIVDIIKHRKISIILIITLILLSVGSFSSPEYAQNAYNLGLHYYEIGRYDLTIQEVGRIVDNGYAETVPDLLHQCIYLLGMSYLRLDQYAKAQSYFNEIIHNPRVRVLEDEAKQKMILSYILDEDYLEALVSADQYSFNAAGKYIGNSLMLKADTLIILGRKEEAKELLLTIINDHVVSDYYFDAIIRLKQLAALGEAQAVAQEVIVYEQVPRVENREIATEYREISEEEFNEYLQWQEDLKAWEDELSQREEALNSLQDMLARKETLLEYKEKVLKEIDERLQERIDWINEHQ